MKAPWFPFYCGDFLASSDVQLMEAHEVGAYVLLLTHSWQSDTPGYLPNDEGRLRRLARLSVEVWKDCAALLLSKWPVAEDATLRYNPRLRKEADKQVELRELKAEAGRKSAERRARLATEGQQKGNRNPTGVEITATGDGENGNYSQPQSQPQEGKPSATSSLQSEVEPAPEKKIEGEYSSHTKSIPENPADASHTRGGGANVGTRKGRGRARSPAPPPGSSNPADYNLPEWADASFLADATEWLGRRQSRSDVRPLQTAAVQEYFTELAGYTPEFCQQLFSESRKHLAWQGLTFKSTPLDFAQHILKLQQLQANANRINQPERGAKPTEAASYGARAVSAQLRAIREERRAQNGSYVDTGAAAGTNAGLGSPVPAGIGAPQG